ncbi:hypothetical protein V8B55DRAFT_1579862 [Mucor lusitanicus]|uniref:F-box domain-containing protein n=1 Tax=Mucor lusitanicus CBS 277.49 TaxID=747725 RepID=A0A168NEZ8_MUCCL|nr:hypothetical protein MUCCIDRAFT_106750 [Mucor lusitanicus CBS 277.49]
MHLTDLPVEIIENILGYLPRHAKQQCLLVCKSWYQVTLPHLNCYIQLLGSEDVMILYRKMCHPPATIKGSDIRCLSFTAEKASDRYIVRKDVLVHIINACRHLQTLHLLHDSNQFLECMYQTRSELQISALQTIHIPFDVVDRVMRDRELRAIFYHCQKITRMSLNIRRDTVMRAIAGNMYKTDNNNPTAKPIFPVKSQLHTLIIDTSFFSKDLLEYLALHTKNLYQMTLCGTASRSAQNIIDTLTTYSKEHEQVALDVKSICFDNYLACSDKLIQQVKSSFSSSLRRLNFTQCDFSDIRDKHNNLTLDLTGLNLDYLIIDIQNIFEGRIASLNKTSLEVTISHPIPKTVYYQRISKWKPDNLFVLKHSNQYINQNAQNRRLKSEHICVLTIRADSIYHMRLYCHNQETRQLFSQIIDFKA